MARNDLVFLLLSLILVQTFALKLVGRLSPRRHKTFSAYIPPELDPEYQQTKVQKTYTEDSKYIPTPINLTCTNTSSIKSESYSYPLPKEGDIVFHSGRWGDKYLGRIRFLRYLEKNQCYFAEIVPLKEGKSANMYVLDTSGQTEYLSVNEVSPVRALFVRSENGYKITFKEGTSEPILRAAQYRKVDKTTYTPPSKKVNFGILESDFKDYDALKSRIITSTLQIGLVGAVAIQFYLSDINLTSAYLLGVLGSCVYFYLLSKKVDDMGSSYSAMNDRPKSGALNNTSTISGIDSVDVNNTSIAAILPQENVKSDINADIQADVSAAEIPLLFAQYVSQRLTKVGANARLLVPILVLALLAGRDYYYGGYTPSKLNYVPRNEFISAVSGFLTLRVALFINEVGRELKGEELIGLVPGSLAVTLRSILFPKKDGK